ncbi:hypothetical protein DENSPDRAFT_198111 [Dentipellis sp. KUC8613]|nr:hypothetical protein DENSPDRAFT_198111 [Dentipellis sp. KUC8613]
MKEIYKRPLDVAMTSTVSSHHSIAVTTFTANMEPVSETPPTLAPSSPTLIPSDTLPDHIPISHSQTSDDGDERRNPRETEALMDLDWKPEPGTKLRVRQCCREDESLDDLPLVWYGVPFEKKHILKYAEDNDLLHMTYAGPSRQKSDPQLEVDFPITAAGVKRHVVRRYGAHIRMRVVFKAPMISVDKDIQRFKEEFGIESEGWYLDGDWGLL